MDTFICFEEIDEIYNLEMTVNQVEQTKASVDKVLINDTRVLENMLNEEKSNVVRDYCGDVQTEIAAHMRKIVTDWMLEVCEDQQCQPEVFFLAVNYLDRFLSLVNIKKSQFQLLASVCILLASKFSQVVPITSEQLVIYTDNSVSVDQIRQWELHVLNVLQWEIASVTAHSFLEHFLNRDQTCAKTVRRQAANIAAVAATEYKFITTKQSVIAAAALALAVQQLGDDTEHLINNLSDCIKVSRGEVVFFMHHLNLHTTPLEEDSDTESGYSSDSCHSDIKVSESVSSATQTPKDCFLVSNEIC